MDDDDEDEDDEGGGGDDEEGGENGGDNYYENYYGNGVDVDDEQPVGYASQTIDFFGEISGVAFGGSDSLYIGNAGKMWC